MNSGLEVKVGIFVVAATVIIAVMGAVFGKMDFSRDKGYEIRFEILDASGINKDVQVFYRGVPIGTMKDITLEGEDLIATLILDKSFQIPDNVVFTVRQRGFVGEKYVELVRDPQIPAAGFLQSGQVYDGRQNVVSMDAVMAKIDKAAEQIAILVGALNDVFARDDSKAALNESIQSLRSITSNIETLIAANDEKFDEIIENARSLTASMDRIVAKNERSVDTSIKNIKELTASLKNFSASIDKLMENNTNNIDGSLANIKEITDKLNVAMDDIKSITKDLNEGKGTLGMLINDNETKEEVKSVVSNVKNMVSRVSEWNLDVTFGADYLFDANDARGYVNLRLHTTPSTFYLLGVSNTPRVDTKRTTTRYTLVTSPGNAGILPDGTVAFESVKDENKSSKLAFNLQYGHIFEKIIGMRVGIFESTLGGAVDLYPLRNDNLSLSFEIYDFNSFNSGFEAYTRAYIRWHFFRNFFIQAGVEDILNNTNRVFALGGGVRFVDNDLKFLAGSAGSAASAVQ